ncbi:MAG: DUF126 domain-containing protein [Acidimicrobiia bacterium]|nr:DUF126 domain-containing protein [Acidimicrobiia bacterium]
MAEIEGTPLFTGSARGRLLVLDEPISFWGGVDHSNGTITDFRHPQHGETVTDRILAMPSGRGSSSSSSVFAELIRKGVAPNGVILGESDEILVLGAIVGELLYKRICPFLLVTPTDYAGLATGAMISIDNDRLLVERSG